MHVKQLVLSLMLIGISITAYAQPKIEVTAMAEKEIQVKEAERSVTKRVPAESIESGEELIYTLRYKNVGSEKATNVKLDNPVPPHTAYVSNSAFGANTEILFSLDGKHFSKPGLLTYVIKTKDGKTEKQIATPDQFSHLRWALNEVPPGASGEVGFRVRVK